MDHQLYPFNPYLGSSLATLVLCKWPRYGLVKEYLVDSDHNCRLLYDFQISFILIHRQCIYLFCKLIGCFCVCLFSCRLFIKKNMLPPWVQSKVAKKGFWADVSALTHTFHFHSDQRHVIKICSHDGGCDSLHFLLKLAIMYLIRTYLCLLDLLFVLNYMVYCFQDGVDDGPDLLADDQTKVGHRRSFAQPPQVRGFL